MAYASDTLGSGFSNAVSDDIPVFIGGNPLEGYTEIQLHTSDVTINGVPYSDQADTTTPARFAVDGRPWTATDPVANGSTRTWLWVRVSDGFTFDALYVQMLHTTSTYDITVDIADGFSDASNVLTVYTVSDVPANGRIFSVDLGSGSVQYSDVTEFRILFDGGTAGVCPVGQVVAGQRRQLSRGFTLPYDDTPIGWSGTEGFGSGHQRSRRVDFSNHQDFVGSYRANRLTTDSIYGFNDETTIRDLYSDCSFGSESVVFIPHPSSNDASLPHQAYYGMLGPQLIFPLVGPFVRDWSFEFLELPPFWRNTR